MRQPDQPKQLGERIAAQRKALEERPDVSQRLRELMTTKGQGPTSVLRRSPLLGMALLGGAVLLLVICAVSATITLTSGLWLRGNLVDPSTTTQNFYGAMHHQDYHSAYALCSTRYQSQVSESDFTSQLGKLDMVAGTVDRYIITQSQTHGQTASVTVQVVRHANPTSAQVQKLVLVQQNGSWRVDAVESGDSVPAATPASLEGENGGSRPQ